MQNPEVKVGITRAENGKKQNSTAQQGEMRTDR